MAKDNKEGKIKRRDDVAEEAQWAATRFVQDAERFKALGDATRLAIIGFLLTQATEGTLPQDEVDEDDNSADGATVTEIASALMGKNGKELSTLSHHLKELRHSGLVVMTRHGKNLHYRAETPAIAALCERIHCPILDKGEVPATEIGTIEKG